MDPSPESLLDGLKKDLQAIPACERFQWNSSPIGPDHGFDAVGEFFFKERSRPLRWALEIKLQSLEPRMADLIGSRLSEVSQSHEFNGAVVLASYVSEASAEKLGARGIGYWDASGNCRIASDSLYIERKGFSNKFIRRSSQGSFFTKAGQRLLRVLLDPEWINRTWTLRELQEVAYPSVSLGQVQNLVKALENWSYLSRTNAGVMIQDPEKLLRAWAESASRKKVPQQRFYTLLNQEQFRAQVEDLHFSVDRTPRNLLLASFSAAAVVDPHVRQHRNFLYSMEDPLLFADNLKMKPVPDGENVIVYTPQDEGVFYGWKPGQPPVTCTVQTFVDLIREGGRGVEAAEHLFERYLKPRYAK